MIVAKDKLIFRVNRFGTMGIKVVYERTMNLSNKVIGLEAICIEVTISEVMGRRILGKMGNKISETKNFEMKDIEVTNLEAKIGHEVMCSEATINKVLGKRFNDVKSKTIFEVMGLENVDSVKVSIEEKVKIIFMINCFEANGIKVTINNAKQGIKQTTFKEIGMPKTIRKKGLLLYKVLGMHTIK